MGWARGSGRTRGYSTAGRLTFPLGRTYGSGGAGVADPAAPCTHSPAPATATGRTLSAVRPGRAVAVSASTAAVATTAT